MNDPYTNSNTTAKAPTMAELLALRDSMLIAHPENIDKLLGLSIELYRPPDSFRFRVHLDGVPLIASHRVPKTQKTGRVIWPDDPYITYEAKDRGWGLALGFCKEEEEIVFYSVPGPPPLVRYMT